jgi:hypothetical protein
MELSEPLNRSGHERDHLVTVRNVNADARDPVASPEFGNDLVDFFSPEIRGEDGRAFGEQPSDTGRPDAGAGTRYQDSPIFKSVSMKEFLRAAQQPGVSPACLAPGDNHEPHNAR